MWGSACNGQFTLKHAKNDLLSGGFFETVSPPTSCHLIAIMVLFAGLNSVEAHFGKKPSLCGVGIELEGS